MKSINKFLTTSVAGLVILAIFSNWLYDHSKQMPVVNSILAGFVAVRSFAVSVFSYKIAVWIILTVLAVVALVVFLIRNVTIEKPPTYCNYIQEQFKDWVWKWDYNENWQVINLAPYCPQCDVKLIAKNIGSRDNYWTPHARCPSCAKEWERDAINWRGQIDKGKTEYVDETRHLIEANIEQLISEHEKHKAN